jgi:hypothetical protein
LADAALLFKDPTRLYTAVEFAKKFTESGSALSTWTEIIQASLGDLPGVHVRWEWQHAAHIADRIPRDSSVDPIWETYVRRCGAVVVVCDRDATVYEAFGRLHAQLPFASAGSRGSAFGPTASGYFALHTSVFLRSNRRGRSSEDSPILVKIMSRFVDERRFDSFAKLEVPLRDSSPSPRDDGITVLTPSGNDVRLPRGATVLNFASKIHDEFVVLARGARVNREAVGLLDELHEGDVVWIDLGVAPRLLPDGWENKVPGSTHNEIKQKFKKYYRVALENSGERWLRGELLRRGLSVDTDLDGVRELLKLAFLSKPLQSLPHREDPSWWLGQMGVLEAKIRGESIPHELVITEAQRAIVAEEVARLTFEHLGAGRARTVQGPQHLVIEGADRAGLVADVATVFAEREVGISEFVAIQLNPGRGLLRVRVDPMEPARLEELIHAIRRTSSVRAVHPPGAEQISDEKHFLPQRQDSVIIWPSMPSPYVRGEPVRDDVHFYGMRTQLAKLRELYESTLRQGGGSRSRQAFISGPKKVGKTSLVLAFLRSIVGRERCVGVHLEAVSHEKWDVYAQRLAEEIHRRAVEVNLGARSSLPTPNLRERSLGEFVRGVQAALDCPLILAVDEVVLTFFATQLAREEREIFEFLAAIQQIPKLLVIWVGPEAAIRHLSDSLQHLLRSTRQIPMKPFSRGVLAEFLRAQKMASKYTIYVEKNLVDAIFELTAGNPYWAASLADDMWSSLTDENFNYLHYDETRLERAIKHVSQHHAAFADRYESDLWTQQQKDLAWYLLVTLAQSSDLAIRTAELVSQAALAGIFSTPALVLELLEELEERGAIIHGGDGWQISAPLFAKHVLVRQQRLATDRDTDDN